MHGLTNIERTIRSAKPRATLRTLARWCFYVLQGSRGTL